MSADFEPSEVRITRLWPGARTRGAKHGDTAQTPPFGRIEGAARMKATAIVPEFEIARDGRSGPPNGTVDNRFDLVSSRG